MRTMLLAIAVAATGCASIDDADLGDGATEDLEARGSCTGVLTITAPLTLDRATVVSGETIAGSVTFRNDTGCSIRVEQAVIAARPPGGTKAGGPYLDFSPARGPLRLKPGKQLTLDASRTIAPSDPAGEWYAFATYQTSDGQWHDPGETVSFTVGEAPAEEPPGEEPPGDDPPPPPDTTGLHVIGNQIVNAAGEPVRLFGVNRSGSEYACIQGWGFFDGRTDQAAIDAIKSWKANAVRIPLNETCWLAINGAPATYSGENYRQAIEDYVARLLASGVTPILELHWAAPGTNQATGLTPMPNRDHSVDFWVSVASRFKGDNRIVFELYNEPYPDNNSNTTAAWTCWRDGGSCPGMSYQAAGMQELVDAVRSTGATNLILLGGVQYSNSLWRWAEFKPHDPASNLAAAWHIYNFNWYTTAAAWEEMAGSLAATTPIVATEIGEDDCSGFIRSVMTWLDGKGQSYLAWTWNLWGTSCGSIALVSDESGTPTQYGRTFRDHLATVAP